MNLEELRELLQLLDERQVAEFELEEGGRKLRIHKSLGGASARPAAMVRAESELASAAGAGTGGEASGPGSSPLDVDGAQVKSPIVGTFYRSPDPSSPPFVNVGDHVRVGQVLCIVEAMKLMNEIEAEQAGTILKVHPENGQPVQYGDPLFTVKPD